MALRSCGFCLFYGHVGEIRRLHGLPVAGDYLEPYCRTDEQHAYENGCPNQVLPNPFVI